MRRTLTPPPSNLLNPGTSSPTASSAAGNLTGALPRDIGRSAALLKGRGFTTVSNLNLLADCACCSDCCATCGCCATCCATCACRCICYKHGSERQPVATDVASGPATAYEHKGVPCWGLLGEKRPTQTYLLLLLLPPPPPNCQRHPCLVLGHY